MESKDFQTDIYGTFAYNLISNIFLLGAIAILASIAVIATCIVILAIGNTWNNIKRKLFNLNQQRKYNHNHNLTEIVYYYTRDDKGKSGPLGETGRQGISGSEYKGCPDCNIII